MADQPPPVVYLLHGEDDFAIQEFIERLEANLGDATMLPPAMPLSPVVRIAANFGKQFVAALRDAPVGKWFGPVHSIYGLHLVRIDEWQAERDPQLEEIRDAVTNEWRLEKRQAIAEQRYAKLREGYEIVIEQVPDETSPGADMTASQ